MRIGIDLRPLQAETKHRGIGKSLEFFLKEIATFPLKDHLVLYIDGDTEKPAVLGLFPEAQIIQFNSHSITRKKYIRSIVNPWRPIRVSPNDIDVLLQYDVALGIPKNVPTVVIFHDLIPYLFHDEEKRIARTKSLKRTLKNKLAGTAYWQQYNRFLERYKFASTIIAISESSKNDYKRHLSFPTNQRLTVIPHGVDSSFFVARPQKLSMDLSTKITKPYFLYIGGIDYRKNVAGLLEDFLKVRQSHSAQLVLVGKEFSLQSQLDDLGWANIIDKHPDFKQDIIRPGFVSHDDLIALLSNASAFVFPSRYEGFGMPLLEAMAAGCPVITYSNSALREVAGTNGTIVSDGESFAPAMKRAITHPDDYAKKVSHARKWAQDFTWHKTANAILQELHRYGPLGK